VLFVNGFRRATSPPVTIALITNNPLCQRRLGLFRCLPNMLYAKENYMFIVSITYKTQLSEVDKYIDEHISYLEKYYALGKFIASGRKVPRTGGIILVNAANMNELDLILKEDPFNSANVADYEVTEFVPTMAATGFEAIKGYI